MLTFALVFLLTLLFLLLLWVTRNQRPLAGGLGEVIVRPDFQPRPRPSSTFAEPPRNPVVIEIVRNEQGRPIDIAIDKFDLFLPAGEQAGWSGGRSMDGVGAKVEIRFSPSGTPFGGDAFSTSRSGNALSGVAVRGDGVPRKYTILATTPDGYLLTKTATLTPAAAASYEESRQGIRETPKGGFGTRIEIPGFKPIRRPGGGNRPPSKEVRISVLRGDDEEIRINVEPEEVLLHPTEQIAWTTGAQASETGGKIEIRFAPNSTPFEGHTFITARGGTAFSGFPVRSQGSFRYKVLFTTPEGYFQVREQDASVVIRSR